MRTTGPHICPTCGERASAFAAGCAFCGTELDPKRAQHPGSLRDRMAAAMRAQPRILPRIGIPLRRR